ncbi:MAG: hypothetical protein J6B07_05930 [Opitutales bacterium]|nr:hypothetical protein [Opitutales bacterium]
MKCRNINIIVLSIILAFSASGQLVTQQMNPVPQSSASAVKSQVPSVPSVSPTNTAGANVSSAGGIFESATSERFADRIFDTKTDSIDFEKGTFSWKGKSFDIGNSRVVRARFERYLALPQITRSFTNYQSIISEIESNLSASNDRLSFEELRPIWKRLYDAAMYDVDGGACVTIANLVYSSWRMRSEVGLSEVTKADIAREKLQAERHLNASTTKMEWNIDNHARTAHKGAKQIVSGTGALAEKLKKVQEKTAELVAASASSKMLGAKAVLQFQSQILMFMLERKFQQAQIASMFYRHIYRGSVQDFKSGSKELFASFDTSTFIPTVDSIESLANDARKDIRDGVAVVENLYSKGDRYSALMRLLETFALGENDPHLIALDASKRAILLKIYRCLATLRELSESRDFTSIELAIAEMQALAKDFPAIEIMAKVKAAKQASSMCVMAARQSAFAGDMDKAKKSLTEAIKIWPLNPEIEKFNKEAMGAVTGTAKYSEKFDDAIKAKNYRAIVAEAPEFTMALRDNPEKQQLLRKIVVDITKLDAFIAQAAEMVKQNNHYLAWDILESARSIDENDPILANERARLAPDVADYVKLLNKAKKAEMAQQYAIALNYYLAARNLSPASSLCRIGIEKNAPLYAR